MSKEMVDVFEYSELINRALPKGILLTTKAGKEVDAMVIGWGQLGILWGRPTFTAFVRPSRHTYALLDRNPEFTVNVPLGEMNKNITAIAGSKSGRDLDKIAELGLTLVEPEVVNVPAIKELPLTLECRVMCQQAFSKMSVREDLRERYYPPIADFDKSGNCYYHEMYFAEVVAAYICK